MQRAATAYFQTQVTTTSQGDLVVMLYDGAVKFLNQAKEYLAENNMAQKGIAISKALDVINELDSTLNMDKGGSLASNLHGLYLFCSNHLVKANLKKDPAMLDDVIKILTGLRGAYADILTLPEAQAAAQEAAANLRSTAIMPPRALAGNTTTGAEALAPGANARIRAMYAKQATETPLPAQAESSELPDAGAKPEAEPPQTPGISSEPQAEQKPQPASAMPPPVFPSSGGFGNARSHASLLRKFSS